jgi:hypothetical protein
MTPPDTATIQGFANRSDQAVTRMTMYFAMGGALLEIVTSTISTIFNTSIPGLWGMWIPLCFVTIPPIHYLCRRVQSLQQRIEELERHIKSHQE